MAAALQRDSRAPRWRPATTTLAANRLTSHSHGAGSVSSKSLMSNAMRRSGVANAPKLRRWASPPAWTRNPVLGVFAKSKAINDAAPRRNAKATPASAHIGWGRGNRGGRDCRRRADSGCCARACAIWRDRRAGPRRAISVPTVRPPERRQFGWRWKGRAGRADSGGAARGYRRDPLGDVNTDPARPINARDRATTALPAARSARPA